MSHAAVARNYAEALFELAGKEGAEERFGELLGALVAVYREEERFRLFLDTPRVTPEEKREAVREVLGPSAPERLLHFLLVVLEMRRQRALPEIDDAYGRLLDDRAGRVHTAVSVAFEPDEDLRAEVEAGLEKVLKRRVVTHFRRDPAVIGGIRVRVGDRVMDGSLRRRLEGLRRELKRTGPGSEPATERKERDGDNG
ncbi:MAG: ATP synthase F1 subunit delta [Gemmatimonadota bacterium]